MFSTTKLLIASLAVLNIAALDIPLSDVTPLLVRDPQVDTQFRVYDAPLDVSHVVRRQSGGNKGIEDKIRIALAYLKNERGIQVENVRVTDTHTNIDTGVSHIYARQTAGGVDVLNGLANVNIDKHGRVISSSQTFAPIHQVRKIIRSGLLTAHTDQDASLKAALKSLSKYVKSELDDDALNRAQISEVEPDETHVHKFIIENIPTNTAVNGMATAQQPIMQRSELDDGALNRVQISEVEPDETHVHKFIIKNIPTNTAVNGMATAQQAMMQKSDGSLVHVWDIELKQADHWWNARINAETGGIESLADWLLSSGNARPGDIKDGVDNLKHAGSIGSASQYGSTYRAIPITRQDPTEGFANITNPETASSPIGWVYSTNTAGNNVVAFKGSPSSGVAQGSSAGSFVYVQDGSQSPTVAVNANASIVQLFYTVNTLHDTFYLYGFTESGFNFQDRNFDKGGIEGDRVLAFAQDGINSFGSFATPPDGRSGELRVSLFNLTSPYRDGSFEVGMVSHLYTLGMTGRLTGGGTASCLQTLESRGLQAGWGDAVADWISQTSAVGDSTIGRYVSNNPRGIRTYPYSRNATVNPLTYGSLRTLPAHEHDIGEVWANMLHNVMATFVDAYGWSNTALINSIGEQGNVVFMHLFMDGLSIQPCNPTFLNARDAFIQADYNRYGGKHSCTIWRAFASRGLGTRAANYVNDFTIPAGC
jgi:hypothetical protein